MLGDRSEAIKCEHESLEIRRKNYRGQPDHPYVAPSVYNLACSYYNNSDYPTAVKIYNEALEMYRRIHRDQPEHPDVERSLECLANAYKLIGDHSEYIKCQQDLSEINGKKAQRPA